ncbi:MAG: phosphoglucosamine mutase, partial [Betaproteobacteria bacterium]
LRELGWDLGGENSGHILCLDKHTTGDGIVSALQVLQAICSTGKSLAELTAGMQLYPQVLVNVAVERHQNPTALPSVQSAVRAAEKRLSASGRVLLRPSGTEPLIRVMVEGESGLLIRELAEDIASSIRAR